MDPVLSLKRTLPVDYSVCIFCQTHKPRDPVSKATDHGLTTVKNAAITRKKLKDTNNTDLINRLENVFDSAEARTLVWHRICYAHFTDKSKIERLQKSKPVSSEEASCSSSGVLRRDKRSLRKGVQPVNWNLCIFCETDMTARLINVMTKAMSDQILQASHLDYKIHVRLAGVIDLIAAEAKYHLTCLSKFTRSTSKVKQDSADTDLAMIWLCRELKQSAHRGYVLLLDDVWDRYKELADESSAVIKQSFLSRSTTFKEKLQSHLGDTFNFFQPLDRCPSERKTMLIPTEYQPTAVLKLEDETQEAEETITLPRYEPDDDITLSLIHVALKIRGDMMAAPGHKGFSVSEDEAITCVRFCSYPIHYTTSLGLRRRLRVVYSRASPLLKPLTA